MALRKLTIPAYFDATDSRQVRSYFEALAESPVHTTSVVVTPSGAITTQIPLDDTTPTISEGGEIVSSTFTPENPTGSLIVSGYVPFVVTDTSTTVIVTIFDGTTLIGVVGKHITATLGSDMTVTGEISLTSVAERTISMRIGPSSSASLTVDGVFGIDGHPFMRILEVN